MVYNLLFWLNSILKVFYTGKRCLYNGGGGELAVNGVTLLFGSHGGRLVFSRTSYLEDSQRQRGDVEVTTSRFSLRRARGSKCVF